MEAGSLVSVIIPAYNYGRFLGATLESILAQSYRNLEVIVVDDGSTDNTPEVVQQFAGDARLKCITQSNQGAIIATNRGIELSKGQYIASCGSDDFWKVDHIRQLMQAFDRFPDAGMVFDNAEYYHEGKGEENLKHTVPAAVANRLHYCVVPLKDTFVHNWITGITCLVRREVLDRVGLIDPELRMVGDLHFLYRICAFRPVVFVDYIGARIRIHDSNMTVLEPHYEHGVRSLEHFRNHFPDICEKIGWEVFNRKLGRKYFRLARHCEKTGKIEAARENYKKAFLSRKSRLRYLWSYLRLCCRAVLKPPTRDYKPV
jgi:glycosyltransferase involved in cell wall biosynthesis